MCRPRISSTTPAAPSNLRLAKVTATGSVTLTWDSTPGRTYLVQYSNGPIATAANWQTLTAIPAAAAPATSTSHTDTGTLLVAGRTKRFYRIGLAP